jgi:hypothetical protein
MPVLGGKPASHPVVVTMAASITATAPLASALVIPILLFTAAMKRANSAE